MSEVGESIIRALKQALAIVEGTAEEGTYVVHTPDEIEARMATKRNEALARESAEKTSLGG
jgi:hypothetical protein